MILILFLVKQVVDNQETVFFIRNETIESGNLMSMSVYPKITGDLDPPIRIALAHLNVRCYKI